MQSLRLTNFLLAVIAICLVYQCVMSGASPSSAQATPSQMAGVQQVQIVGTPEVRVVGARADVPVNIKNWRVPVEIRDSTVLRVRVENFPR